MKVALVYNARLPAKTYGGTERAVWWLAKGLAELGHSVTLVCKPGSKSSFASIVTSRKGTTVPEGFDLYHHFEAIKEAPDYPYVITIEGNAQTNELFLENCVFVSRNHAQRHQAECFVYNPIDPDEYVFRAQKESFFAYLAKTSWRVKNVKGAIRIAEMTETPLKIMGGFGWPQRSISWMGMVGGKRKAETLARAKALLFPVVWDEPFGIAVVEALVSGTPVLATPFGSLPELVPPEVGFLCRNYVEFMEAGGKVDTIDPERCRDWANSQFHYRKIAEDYLALYKRVLSGGKLNPLPPRGGPLARPLYALGN